MNYHHLTIEERCCIRKYYNDGLSFRKIAQLIGRSPSTISREINRNKTYMNVKPAYYPHTAQKKYLLRRSYCHRGMFQSQEIVSYIEDKLLATWSPEQIASTPAPVPLPSWRTIYRWLYDRYLLNGNLKVLRRKGRSHGVKETRGKFNKGKSIRRRDRSVYSRKDAGHWEADTVVSGQGKSKVCFATLVERKTRYYIAVKMPDRKADTMAKTIIKTNGLTPKRDKSKRKYHRDPRMSSAEIITIMILFHLSGYKCFKHFYINEVQEHLTDIFPICRQHIASRMQEPAY